MVPTKCLLFLLCEQRSAVFMFSNLVHDSTDLKISDTEALEILKVASHGSSRLDRFDGSHTNVNGIMEMGTGLPLSSFIFSNIF